MAGSGRGDGRLSRHGTRIFREPSAHFAAVVKTKSYSGHAYVKVTQTGLFNGISNKKTQQTQAARKNSSDLNRSQHNPIHPASVLVAAGCAGSAPRPKIGDGHRKDRASRQTSIGTIPRVLRYPGPQLASPLYFEQ